MTAPTDKRVWRKIFATADELLIAKLTLDHMRVEAARQKAQKPEDELWPCLNPDCDKCFDPNTTYEGDYRDRRGRGGRRRRYCCIECLQHHQRLKNNECRGTRKTRWKTSPTR
jgi:hypothetical protein